MAVITLALAKEYLEISHNRQDNVLAVLIDGAEGYVASLLGVALTSAPRQEDLDGDDRYLLPRFLPVTAVATVVDRWNNNAPYTFLLESASRIAWVSTEGYVVGDWPKGQQRFRVNYTGGYTEVPGPVKLAILQLIYRAYQARGAEGSANAGGASMSWAALAGSDIHEQLRHFSRRRVVRF